MSKNLCSSIVQRNALSRCVWSPSVATPPAAHKLVLRVTVLHKHNTSDASHRVVLCSKHSSDHFQMSQVLREEPAFFWMPDDRPYGALSHWYLADMTDDASNNFLTVEHYMMYHKSMLFGDQAIAKDILAMKNPDEVQAAGRRVQGFDRQKWTAHREQIVFDGNFLKFSQNDQLKQLLLDTKSRPLVEASPEDDLWGIGFSAADAPQHIDSWGDNLCGKAIEKVRSKLQGK